MRSPNRVGTHVVVDGESSGMEIPQLSIGDSRRNESKGGMGRADRSTTSIFATSRSPVTLGNRGACSRPSIVKANEDVLRDSWLCFLTRRRRVQHHPIEAKLLSCRYKSVIVHRLDQ
jgi:hypothetical protein